MSVSVRLSLQISLSYAIFIIMIFLSLLLLLSISAAFAVDICMYSIYVCPIRCQKREALHLQLAMCIALLMAVEMPKEELGPPYK